MLGSYDNGKWPFSLYPHSLFIFALFVEARKEEMTERETGILLNSTVIPQINNNFAEENVLPKPEKSYLLRQWCVKVSEQEFFFGTRKDTFTGMRFLLEPPVRNCYFYIDSLYFVLI